MPGSGKALQPFGESMVTTPSAPQSRKKLDKKNQIAMVFDIGKAIAYLDRHVQNASTGWCLQSVEDALNAGGWYPERPGQAKGFDSILKKDPRFVAVATGNGGNFSVQSANYRPRPGDIVVWTGAEAGHIAMYNRQNWESDFKANPNNWTGLKNPKSHGAFTIYRQTALLNNNPAYALQMVSTQADSDNTPARAEDVLAESLKEQSNKESQDFWKKQKQYRPAEIKMLVQAEQDGLLTFNTARQNYIRKHFKFTISDNTSDNQKRFLVAKELQSKTMQFLNNSNKPYEPQEKLLREAIKWFDGHFVGKSHHYAPQTLRPAIAYVLERYMGYQGNVFGKEGYITKEAIARIEKFQRDSGIAPTKNLGRTTLASLLSHPHTDTVGVITLLTELWPWLKQGHFVGQSRHYAPPSLRPSINFLLQNYLGYAGNAFDQNGNIKADAIKDIADAQALLQVTQTENLGVTTFTALMAHGMPRNDLQTLYTVPNAGSEFINVANHTAFNPQGYDTPDFISLFGAENRAWKEKLYAETAKIWPDLIKKATISPTLRRDLARIIPGFNLAKAGQDPGCQRGILCLTGLLCKVIDGESSWNPKASLPNGKPGGLFQADVPDAKNHGLAAIKTPGDIYNPLRNIELGIKILKDVAMDTGHILAPAGSNRYYQTLTPNDPSFEKGVWPRYQAWLQKNKPLLAAIVNGGAANKKGVEPYQALGQAPVKDSLLRQI